MTVPMGFCSVGTVSAKRIATEEDFQLLSRLEIGGGVEAILDLAQRCN